MVPRCRPALVPLALLLLFAAAVARAGWPNPTTEHVPLCTASGTQGLYDVVTDGAGGAIVAWVDQRTGTRLVYAHRVSATGVPMWAVDGVPVCAVTSWKGYVEMIPDGAGGAFVVWTDERSGTQKVFAQRIAPNGKSLWTSTGVPVATSTSVQFVPRMVSDGADGVIVVWRDHRSGSYQLYAQRLDGGGALQWASGGLAICTSAVSLYSHQVIENGRGGAIVVWADSHGGTRDIYAQYVTGTGVVGWALDGVVVCDAAGSQNLSSVVADDAGGAFIAWDDLRTGDFDVYAQRIDSFGDAMWTADGVAVTSLTSQQESARLVRDGGTGVLVAWSDTRADLDDIYAQRLSGAGAAQWTANGVVVSAADDAQRYPRMIPDGAGGAVVVWEDLRFDGTSIYAQRVNSSGTMQWTANGVEVCRGTLALAFGIVPDDAGGFIAAWDDNRSGVASEYDIYAQHVDPWGYLGAQPTIAGVGDVRGDQGGVVRLSWYASPLDLFPSYSIYAYDLYRAVPADLATHMAASGRTVIDEGDAEFTATPGTLLRRTTAQGVQFWEFLESVLARHLSGYSYLAATTCDSMPGANPLTSFMVVARNSGTTRWWCSDPDSGYSTDDLAPVAPAPFAGAYAGGAATLMWGANAEADLAGYRLYRGTSAAFAPGPANLVAALAATAYVDPAGEPFFYRLTAVDTHGNEGPPATVLPSGALAVDGPGLPRELALSASSPQPARGATTLRLALPRAAQVRLAVFDAQGRRVRALLDEPRAAGEHALRWDGRDDAGRAVPSGLYLLRAEVEGRAFLRRVAMLR